MSALVLGKLKERFGDAIRATHDLAGDDTAIVDPAQIVAICTFLRDEPGLEMAQMIDLTCVDTIGLPEKSGSPAERYWVVYHLRSIATGRRVRLKAAVDDGPSGENPEIDSITSVWKGANWFEREAWDMFGVKFRGHPDLRRILMYDEFIGHPMRKDYPKEKRQPLVRRDFT
ncbi:MAG: NADH-quinone oxidoreductase subunit C [Myxococcales bacterium]|nr:NADH-quinone oxidoreductase subunit C [Myxococcales bacterium]